MKFLIYGGNGWIGQQIVHLLREMNHEVIIGQSRIDNYETTLMEVQHINPDRIICTTGRTSGGNYNNIDYLEGLDKTAENLRDNLQGPVNLGIISNINKTHVTYLGTGCIYHYDDDHPIPNVLDWDNGKNKNNHGFTEDDKPNFFGSQYSIVKGMTDQLIRQYDNVLNARIRMPITADLTSPRNFITKILSYENVIDMPNSMTVLPDLLPVLIDLSINKVTGTVNLVNDGVISPADVIELYKQYVNPDHKYNRIPLSQLVTVGKRSNNYLQCDRLKQLHYVDISDIRTSITKLFENIQNEVKD